MNWVTPMLALLLAAPVFAAQAVPPAVDEAFSAYAALPAKLVPILSEVRDTASADAAAPKLYEALPAVYDARKALRSIPKLSEEETQIIQRKYETTLRQEWGKLFEQIYRLQRIRCYQSIPLFKQFQTLCLMLEK